MKGKKYLLNKQDMRELDVLLPVFSFLLVISGIVFASIYYWYLNVLAAAVSIVICTVFAGFIPLAHKALKNSLVPANLLILALLIAVIHSSYLTGLLHSTSAYWILTIPVLANLLLPLKHSALWLVLTIASCIFLHFHTEESGQVIDLDTKMEFVRIISIVFAVSLIYILTFIQKLKINELTEANINAKLESQKYSYFEKNLTNAIELGHKINNPLTAILLLSKRLKKTCAEDQSVHLISIQNEVKKCAEHSRELIKLSEESLNNGDN